MAPTWRRWPTARIVNGIEAGLVGEGKRRPQHPLTRQRHARVGPTASLRRIPDHVLLGVRGERCPGTRACWIRPHDVMTPPSFAVDEITRTTHYLSTRHPKAFIKPARLSFTEFAAAPMASMTARKGLRDVGRAALANASSSACATRSSLR